MSVFDKTCGMFRLTVSEPSPSWVTIFPAEANEFDYDQHQLRYIRLEDLHDLRYLIDRAIEAAERQSRP
jgi:hypothetical protein